MRAIDIRGNRFGRLVAVQPVSQPGKGVKWECLCDCGNTAYHFVRVLRSGNTKSCGCLRVDAGRMKNFKHGHATRDEYGRPTDTTYAIWRSARARCFQPRNPAYKNYGGRGITMCESWRADYTAFLKDMGPRPPHLTIERIDVNRGYEPSNCRWATRAEQNINTRTNRWFVVDGQRIHLSQLARDLKVCRTSIRDAIKRGWLIQDYVNHIRKDGPRVS